MVSKTVLLLQILPLNKSLDKIFHVMFPHSLTIP